jgi:hypothetical protein
LLVDAARGFIDGSHHQVLKHSASCDVKTSRSI